MLRFVHDEVWVFDAEWVPDPVAGRLVYGLPDHMTDDEVREVMWQQGGATDDDPRPYLKTVLCRIVSIAAVIRSRDGKGRVSLRLHAIPSAADGAMPEEHIIDRFLSAVGQRKPQLVGFNSSNADLPILIQRALVHGLHQPAFCSRPDKPWEGTDYFARFSDWHVDIKEAVGGWGKATPSLHEIASSCGIPGKLDTDGGDVVDLWRKGDVRSIVAYNECDALTTYLLWLRLAHLAGFVSPDEYTEEQDQLRELLRVRARDEGASHLAAYLRQWEASEALRNGREARPEVEKNSRS